MINQLDSTYGELDIRTAMLQARSVKMRSTNAHLDPVNMAVSAWTSSACSSVSALLDIAVTAVNCLPFLIYVCRIRVITNRHVLPTNMRRTLAIHVTVRLATVACYAKLC